MLCFLNNVVFMSIMYILILSVTKSIAGDTTIQILTDKPDFINKENWKEYTSSINYYLLTNASNNSILKDVNISFSYNSDEPDDKTTPEDYKNYVKYIIKQLESSTYDLFVLDGRFLFSDRAFVESSFLEDTFDIRKIHQYYEPLTKDFNKVDLLAYAPSSVVEGGYLDGELYGLPYELDFDLLYYRNENINPRSLNMENINWNDLFSLGIAFGNDDELLDIFTEYNHCTRDFSGDSGTNLQVFYNETSKELLESFGNFVAKSSSAYLRSVVHSTLEEAYDSFETGGSLYFKGKASHYRNLVQKNDQNQPVICTLPPQNKSILNSKYLVVNKNSDVDKNVLKEVAGLLTSKEFQLYRAQQYGFIPTFDITHRDQEPTIQTFYTLDSTFGNFMEVMKSIDLKSMYQSKYGAPFMETRLLLPSTLKEFIAENVNYSNVTNEFENIRNLVFQRSNNKSFALYILYFCMLLFTALSVVVMVLLYKYRKHPNLKIFSPDLCNLVIFGYILDIVLTPFFKIQQNTVFKCQVQYVYDTIVTNLLVLPLLAITFRIYSIYNNRSKLVTGNKLNNRHLFTYILIFLSVMTVLVLGETIFILKFYIRSYGNIETYRLGTCDYDGGRAYEIIERLIYTILFIIMIYMIVKTGKISKHYGQFNFIYVLVLTFIVERVVDAFTDRLPSNRYVIYYVLLVIFCMTMDTLCIYILVGTRLLFIFRHPSNDITSEDGETERYSPSSLKMVTTDQFVHPFQKLED